MRLVRRALSPLMSMALWLGCGGARDLPWNVTGSWNLWAWNLSGGGASCSLVGMSLTLTQSGRTVSGSHTGGTFTCTAPEGTFTDSLDGGPIRNGYLTDADSIGFEVGGSGLRCTGALRGTYMLGTATITRDLGEPLGVVMLSGNCGAEVEGLSRLRDSIIGPCVVPGPCARLRR